MRRSQIAWALLSLVVATTGASATKLDKIACNDLSGELAGVVAAGARDDMERGPAWAQANLPTDRLGNVKRLIEIEEQLEFRCGMGHNRILATPGAAAPEQRAEDKAPLPESPMRKPQVKSDAASPPVKASPDALKPAPQKSATMAPPSATPATEALPSAAPSTGPVRTVTPATKTVSAAVDDANPDIGSPLAAPPAEDESPAATERASSATAPPVAAAPPAAPLASKSSRRTSSAGYVSPSEVNPFFVTRYGDNR
jgi:hypothetical protein